MKVPRVSCEIIWQFVVSSFNTYPDSVVHCDDNVLKCVYVLDFPEQWHDAIRYVDIWNRSLNLMWNINIDIWDIWIMWIFSHRLFACSGCSEKRTEFQLNDSTKRMTKKCVKTDVSPMGTLVICSCSVTGKLHHLTFVDRYAGVPCRWFVKIYWNNRMFWLWISMERILWTITEKPYFFSSNCNLQISSRSIVWWWFQTQNDIRCYRHLWDIFRLWFV